MKVIVEMELRWHSIEVFEVELPDTKYAQLRAFANTDHPLHSDLRSATPFLSPGVVDYETVCDEIARETVLEGGGKLLGVEFVQDFDSDAVTNVADVKRGHLMHPRVWNAIQRAMSLLDPLDQLCMLPEMIAPKEESDA